MKNFTVGSITGIPIRVNVTLLVFLPVLAWLLAGSDQITAYVGVIEAVSPHALDGEALQTNGGGWVIGILGALGLFASVLVHELGHSWTARYYDIEIVSITLWIFGGLAHMKDLPEEWNKEFWIALAGPVTSVVLGVGFLGLLQVLPAGAPVVLFLVGFLGVVNVVLAMFNMLPAFPMDGGRIFRALLARNRPYASATQTAAAVGKGFAILMAVLGIVGFSPVLVLVAMFVFVAASAESRATALRELLRGITVRDLMTGDVQAVAEDDSVADVVERIVRERVTGYPVVDASGTVVGLISLDDVRGVPAGDRETTRVGEVTGDLLTVDPDAHAFDALAAMAEGRNRPLAVVRDGRPLGVVTQEDVVRAMEVIQGLGRERDPELAPDGFA